MSESLLSVGVDVGTTSTQLVVSRLRVENRAGPFAVPDLDITERTVLYKSPVYFTPLSSAFLVDGEKIRALVEREYQNAGILRENVDTGAIIITGETSRKENARRVLQALSHLAGDFVVAVAGPDLESVLAAKGSGAVEHSAQTGETVLHMDIGGGTSNLALIRAGEIIATGCLNVGGRLIRLGEGNVVTYVSPVLQALCPVRPGEVLEKDQAARVCQLLTRTLEMAAGLRPWEEENRKLLTQEAAGSIPQLSQTPVISFSGGVADCIAAQHPWNAYGDIGPLLGKTIRESLLCRRKHLLGKETIRATVIGAGCHSTQLSGSTVFIRNVALPLKNLPVIPVEDPNRAQQLLSSQEGPAVLALPETKAASYKDLAALAEILARQLKFPAILCMEQDMAKALGQALAVRLPEHAGIVCLDRIRLRAGDYLDIGMPVGNAVPVVVKTLVLGKENRRCI